MARLFWNSAERLVEAARRRALLTTFIICGTAMTDRTITMARTMTASRSENPRCLRTDFMTASVPPCWIALTRTIVESVVTFGKVTWVLWEALGCDGGNEECRVAGTEYRVLSVRFGTGYSALGTLQGW